MKIVLIGSGNVATILGRRIKKTQHQVIQVVSRNDLHARVLADELGCSFGSFESRLANEADMYLFAISDSVLYDMDKIYQLGDKLAVHTAGSVSKDVLKGVSANYGVLYPVQSLQKNLDEIREIPFLVDANTEENLVRIENFARELDPVVQRTNDDKRLKTHVAAVFINNFTNHLYLQAEDFCIKENIDFNLLKPLMMETAYRILTHSPKDVLTGPAVRNDTFTLERHLRSLANYPKQKYLYMKLTDSIISK
jgi:predicted short-subunit dehydrogenase-like oxidoreductase (DUF2520 family)